MKNYQEILSISNVSGTPSISVEKGTVKRTVAGFNDDTHDIFTNSAGEGNIARILLAMLSFKRLKQTHGGKYKGGILLIDELDATIYPHSQRKLVEYLGKEATDLRVQVVFTTHSATVLEAVHELYRREKKREGIDAKQTAYDNTIIYLEPKYDGGVRMIDAEYINSGVKLKRCINDMSLVPTLPDGKLNVYCEDKIAISITEHLLERKIPEIGKYISFIDINLGWSNYIQLWEKKVPEFRQSLILLDADVSGKDEYKKKSMEARNAKNIIFLPFNAEQTLFVLLKDTNIYAVFHENFSTNLSFTYDVCFGNWPLSAEKYSANDFKKWYKYIEGVMGKKLLFDFLLSRNEDKAECFVRKVYDAYSSLADELSLDPLPNLYDDSLEFINDADTDVSNVEINNNDLVYGVE